MKKISDRAVSRKTHAATEATYFFFFEPVNKSEQLQQIDMINNMDMLSLEHRGRNATKFNN